MKKLTAVLLALLVLWSCTACGERDAGEIGIDSELGQVYICTEVDSVIRPSVRLLAENRFSFTFSAVSSYLGVGTYSIRGDRLVLHTDDGTYTYTFRTEGEDMERLIFVADESSDFLHFGEFGDGAVFERVKYKSTAET